MYSFLIIKAHEDVTPFFTYAETNKEEKKLFDVLYFSNCADSAKWSLVFGLILSYSYKGTRKKKIINQILKRGSYPITMDIDKSKVKGTTKIIKNLTGI